MNRQTAIAGLGALALAACSGSLSPIAGLPGTNQNAKSTRRGRMSLPAGYTTSTASSGTIYTTSLFDNGTLIATLSVDSSTWESTLHDYGNGRQWTTTSPKGIAPGSTWTPVANASGTASSDGSELSGPISGSTGYFYLAVDSTTGNYYSEHYHPTYWSTPARTDTNIAGSTGGGTGSGCGTKICPNGVSYECVKAIVGAGFGAIGLVVSAGALLSGALVPLAIIGLVSSHIEFLWAIWQIDEACL